MARRYRRPIGGSARGRRLGSTPPPPIEVKVGKLDFKGLTQAYDWATIDQVFGMRLAFGWYDENAPILLAMNPLDTTGQKTYERAVKAQKLGEGTVIVEEQKQAFTTALHLFEKLWSSKQPALPLIDPALAPDAKPSKSLAWQQTLLEAFKVFQPFGLIYVPSAQTERVILPNLNKPIPMQDVHIPVTELIQMRGSVLSVLLKEAVEVAKRLSISSDGDVPQLDGNLFLTTLPKVLEAVAATAGGKSAVAPKTPRATKSSENGKPVVHGGKAGWVAAGRYKPGSVTATYWLHLKANLGTWFTWSELQKVAPTGAPQDRVQYVAKQGQETGLWTIEMSRRLGQARMTECTI